MKIKADSQFLSLEKAIELGNYDPKFLSQFAEFRELSRYTKFQLIRQALRNREAQLRLHYAELNNQLDFRNKPNLREGLQNIEKQIQELNADEEQLLVEYSR